MRAPRRWWRRRTRRRSFSSGSQIKLDLPPRGAKGATGDGGAAGRRRERGRGRRLHCSCLCSRIARWRWRWRRASGGLGRGSFGRGAVSEAFRSQAWPCCTVSASRRRRWCSRVRRRAASTTLSLGSCAGALSTPRHTSGITASGTPIGSVSRGSCRSGDETECCVCTEGRKTHIFMPCRHMCVCAGCAPEIMYWGWALLGVLDGTGEGRKAPRAVASKLVVRAPSSACSCRRQWHPRSSRGLIDLEMPLTP